MNARISLLVLCVLVGAATLAMAGKVREDEEQQESWVSLDAEIKE
eukprot:CAMPEP_0184699242 /NCGR_PEP_ID=MMETSP0313-20130426/5584_1 /TAXON_ID=2792 /ORGANISM="Porphyridium aerugineum, Strain SAG 1380-2" /LENGTH=44 /DNA_ID= /DNA_START= /DNA_END= /DNA_ORIENTATION=